MKKYICILMILIMAASLPLSASASELEDTFTFEYLFYNSLNVTTNAWEYDVFSSALPHDDAVSTVVWPSGVPAQSLAYVVPVVTNANDIPLKKYHTYKFTLTATVPDGILSWMLGTFKLVTAAETSDGSFLDFPTDFGTNLSDKVFEHSQIYQRNTTDDNTIYLEVLLHVDKDTEYIGFMPIFMYPNAGNTEASTIMYFSIDPVSVVVDYDQEYYNAEILKVQQEIKNSVDSGFSEVNGNLEKIDGTLNDIENALVSDPNHTPDTSTLGEDVGELTEVEGQINEAITKPLTLPDGSTIQTDADTLINIRDWLKSYYHAPEYDADVGKEYARVFETFMPYLGSVIFISLLLGLILAFLTGRRNV